MVDLRPGNVIRNFHQAILSERSELSASCLINAICLGDKRFQVYGAPGGRKVNKKWSLAASLMT